MFYVRERRPTPGFWDFGTDFDRLVSSVFGDWDLPTRSGFHFEVLPGTDAVTIRAELPGIDPSALNIAVNDRALTISGERKPAEAAGKTHLRERSYGAFSRTFHLSDDLDASAIDAECKNGVLTVRVPKRPEAAPLQIAVKTS
jgi:HSP20 family molecular chaperone IbpA